MIRNGRVTELASPAGPGVPDQVVPEAAEASERAVPQDAALVGSSLRSSLPDVSPHDVSMLDAVLLLDEQGLILAVNEAVQRVFGYEPHELVGKASEMLAPVGLRADYRQRRRRFVDSLSSHPGDPWRSRPLMRKDGTSFLSTGSISCVSTDRGPRITVVVHDASPEQTQMGSGRHLVVSQLVAGTGSWEYDHSSRWTHWSEGLHRLLGVVPGFAQPGPEEFLRHVHPDDAPLLAQRLAAAERDGGEWDEEIRIAEPPIEPPTVGSLGWRTWRTVTIQAVVERDRSGAATRTIFTVQDVSARRYLERELRVGHDLFRATFERAPIGMALVDAQPGQPKTILVANRALADLTGLTVPDLLGRSITDLAGPPTDDPTEAAVFSELWAGRPEDSQAMNVRVTHVDGMNRWASLSVLLMHSPFGSPDYYMTHLQDITRQLVAGRTPPVQRRLG